MENKILINKDIFEHQQYQYFLNNVIQKGDNWISECEDLTSFKTKISNILIDMSKLFGDNNDIKEDLENILHSILYETLIGFIYYQFQKEDEDLYSKCKKFCKLNVSPEQLGAHHRFALPFLPAITEFASLDNHKTPSDKLKCFCTTFDLIYADLKFALISIFSEYFASENKIPVIENEDITPIILYVVIKSQPIHLRSNIYYIENFHSNLKTEFDYEWNIFLRFKEAVEQLSVLTELLLLTTSDKVYKDLDLVKLIKITEEQYLQKQISGIPTPLELHNERILSQIITTTCKPNYQ